MGNTAGSHHHGLGKKDGAMPGGVGAFSPGYNTGQGHYFDFSSGALNEAEFDLWDSQPEMRPRAHTITQGTTIQPHALPVVFRWSGSAHAKNVYVSGSFNNWKSKIPLVKSHGDFTTIVELPEGDHEYKFHIDGQWKHDPNNPVKESDVGGKNNIIRVKKADFEVFEALAMDMSTTEREASSKSMSHSPEGEYAQTIPGRPLPNASGPPTLPPHLLQVILNQDISLQYEPNLLPEPNHVMLNHLYALSIKDGVMVLSATHRYRRKFVTSVFYKPIDS